MVNKETFWFGIELECEVNGDEVDIEVGDYHNGEELGQHWTAEDDGSLGEEHFSYGRMIEFVSYKMRYKDLNKYLKDLRKGLYNNKELNKIINFNSSCGAHIHFSVEGKNIHKKVLKASEDRLHKIMKKRMTVLRFGPKFRKKFFDHYYRSYAQKNPSNMRDRYTSINNATGKGSVEWRSFNCRPVKTWKELEKLLQCGLDSILQFVNELEKEKYSYKFEFHRPKVVQSSKQISDVNIVEVESSEEYT